MTREQADELIRTLFAMYPRARMPQMTVDVYCASIMRYEAGPVARALSALAEESEYVPSLAAIHKRVDETGDHRPEGGVERALATAADRTCLFCRGCGWVDARPVTRVERRYSAVRPCSCRGGDPVSLPELDREELSDALAGALGEFETALGAPLSDAASRLVARDLAGPTPQLAVERLRKAVLFAQVMDKKSLVDGVFEKG
ncbi:MAG: hypothetical protein A2902_01650 [Elusimicrobia bacterium RIFCSPLOWO2_01_FULL_64_13]|nr:MAG: hypothetical protein A2902_01650 [Elusimicrobia bacterium RIFCSPLOWO2_01_FULL_64_13]